jgi:NADH-quinone oxidoreductase subunit J
MYFFFFLFAIIGVFSALRVVTNRNVVHAALFLLLTFFCVGAMYVMMRAELLAAVQVLVYAGAVMVLFLFASLIINIPRSLQLRQWNRQSVLGVLMAGVTGLCMIVATARAFGGFAAPELTPLGTPRAVGQLVFSDYILPFELASLVLLAAMVGAIYLARGAADEEDRGAPAATADLAAVGDDPHESL